VTLKAASNDIRPSARVLKDLQLCMLIHVSLLRTIKMAQAVKKCYQGGIDSACLTETTSMEVTDMLTAETRPHAGNY